MTTNSRAGLKWVKVRRLLRVLFQSSRLQTYLSVQRFEDIPVQQLIADGIRGVLVDVDGTLGTHGSTTFSPSILEHLDRMQEAGLKIALYTNDRDDRFEQFSNIAVVRGVAPKPDRKGFRDAMTQFLDLSNPGEVCMIGDNYLTDGGAVECGMRFLHVQPLPGCENPIQRWCRDWAIRRAHRKG